MTARPPWRNRLGLFVAAAALTQSTGAVDAEVAKDDLAAFERTRKCKGHEREWGSCDMGACPAVDACQPQDCVFGVWGDWYDTSGCQGLCIRHRKMDVSNNECGIPCNGSLTDTKACLKPECVKARVDCALGVWGDWSFCDNELGQKERTRTIAAFAANGGNPCLDEVLRETLPCGVDILKDCSMSDWGPWTPCSLTCGGGYQTSTRRILEEADLGKPCDGSLRRNWKCNVQPCEMDSRPCIMSQWSEWQGCDAVKPTQKIRSREILTSPVNGGAACPPELVEALGCPGEIPAQPCTLSEWGDWSACSVDCGNGQQYRARKLAVPPSGGGEPCGKENLHETRGCEQPSCFGDVDCAMTAWSDWNSCSASCGVGQEYRRREILHAAQPNGQGCEGNLELTRECLLVPCTKQDCVWSDWADWGGCTCTCGGGRRQRGREVKISPSNGGAPCEEHVKEETEPCNTGPCTPCVDGLWAAWQDWSPCSTTCDVGFKHRERNVLREPNVCGAALSGPQDEYATCSIPDPADPTKFVKCMPDVDCQLAQWSEWSSCSCACYGTAERHRVVSVFARGNGKSCEDQTLKEVRSCNPGINEAVPEGCGDPTPTPCKMEEWGEWSTCSVSCGGGSKKRDRFGFTVGQLDGQACEGPMFEVAPCNEQTCNRECIDCKWSEWSDWGSCSRCGGQRYRHRSIAQQANVCGKQCEPDFAKETSNCSSICEEHRYCTWSSWEPWGSCSEQCGAASRMRQRSLSLTDTLTDALFIGNVDSACGGSQTEMEACMTPPCTPQPAKIDCVFGDWGEWTAPTCTQLCQRSRVIATINNHLGLPCTGPLDQSKICPYVCDKPVDCQMSDWDRWSDCNNATSQIYRRRHIIRESQNEGLACEESLEETKGCSEGRRPPQDCLLNVWADWTVCDAACAGGIQTRTRVQPEISRHAQYGGAPCDGQLKEVRDCNTQICATAPPVACVLGQWGAWGACDNNQQIRDRTIVTQASNGGAECNDDLRETQQCGLVVNCEFSDWSAWSDCSKICGAGQSRRHRDVRGPAPQNNGTECPELTMETKGCNTEPCSVQHCEIAAWGPWDPCSASCGTGQTKRQRGILKNAGPGGRGCDDVLEEASECSVAPCDIQACIWGEWSQWSSCTCECAGGQRSRDRSIQQMPAAGAPPCQPLPKEETEACNTQPCPGERCVDGQWDDWSPWEQCTATCEGGVTWRHRKMLVEANDCGKPANGTSRQTAACNAGVVCEAPVDCKFSDWDAWTSCSASCSGVQKRARQILQHGRGQGAFCEGALKEVSPCNDQFEAEPPVPPGAACLPPYQLVPSVTVSSNLNYQGPDQDADPVIVFGNVFPGKNINLRVSDTDGTYRTDIEWSVKNKVRANFFQVNVACMANLTFAFVDATTGAPANAAVAPFDQNYLVTFYDLDKAPDGEEGGIESITVPAGIKTATAHNTNLDISTCEPEVEAPVPLPVGCLQEYQLVPSVTKVSNLNHQGPDKDADPVIIFGNVFPGRNIDLKITDPDGSYRTDIEWSVKNKVHLDFFQVNVACKAELNFEFVDASTGKPVDAKASPFDQDYFFTVYDLDKAEEGVEGGIESITVPHGQGIHATTAKDTNLDVKNTSDGLTFTATVVGDRDDDPDSSLLLTPEQAAKVVALRIPAGKTSFNLGLAISNCSGNRGRTFLLSGPSSLSCGYNTCGAGFTRFTATVVGDSDDDPTDPQHLTAEQAAKAVALTIPAGTTSFNLGLAISDCSGNRGRTFIFSGPGPISCGYGTCLGFACPAGFLLKGNPANIMLTVDDAEADVTVCCNQAEDTCAKGPPTDCALAPWSAWTECSAPCAGGQQRQNRDIAKDAENGGKPCEGLVERMQPCNTQACETGCVKVDCQWGEWSPWSACSKCGGQKTRTRHIKTLPACGGAPCSAHLSEEADDCPRACGKTTCAFGEWEDWDTCSVSCGVGTTHRERHLAVREDIPVASFMSTGDRDDEKVTAEDKFEVQRLQGTRHEEQSPNLLQEMGLAFFAGLLFLLALFSVAKVACNRRQVLLERLPQSELDIE